MAGRFAYSKPNRRGPNDPWFRVGAVEIGSAVLLALLCVVSVFVYAAEPIDKPVLTKLALIPSQVDKWELWRLVSWPLANGLTQRLLGVIISIAILWFVGSKLEAQVGRAKMAGFLLTLVVVPGLVAFGLDLNVAGIRAVEFAVLLTFIAENPHLRFFFGIPAWVFGVVYVAADVLQLTGDRAGDQLALYLISLIVAALAARAIGLLSNYPWLPKISWPSRDRKPKRSRQPAVVTGPWAGSSSGPTSLDQSELDMLLDKISATGMESLSKAEKQRLNELSKRLRGG